VQYAYLLQVKERIVERLGRYIEQLAC